MSWLRRLFGRRRPGCSDQQIYPQTPYTTAGGGGVRAGGGGDSGGGNGGGGD